MKPPYTPPLVRRILSPYVRARQEVAQGLLNQTNKLAEHGDFPLCFRYFVATRQIPLPCPQQTREGAELQMEQTGRCLSHACGPSPPIGIHPGKWPLCVGPQQEIQLLTPEKCGANCDFQKC